MDNIRRWFKNKWPLIVFAVYWVIHIYIWLIWRWKNSELFDSAWFFDEAGHALFGIMGAFTLLYLYRTYSLHGIFRFAGKKHLTKDIVEDIAIFGILWEFAELSWDLYLQPNYLDWLAKAQKGAADTVIDIIVNPLFALLALIVFFYCIRIGKYIYKKIYPDDKNIADVEEEIEEALEMLKYLDEKVRFLRKEQLKLLKPKLKEFFHLLGEDKKHEN